MSLTKEEQAAIAAFPKSKVQKIPLGKGVTEFGMVWVDTPGNGGRIVSLHPTTGKPLQPSEAAKIRKNAKAAAGRRAAKFARAGK